MTLPTEFNWPHGFMSTGFAWKLETVDTNSGVVELWILSFENSVVGAIWQGENAFDFAFGAPPLHKGTQLTFRQAVFEVENLALTYEKKIRQIAAGYGTW